MIESINWARFVHDTLEECGWQVEIADAHKVKGLAPLACKTDRIDPACWPGCRFMIWCRRSGCQTPAFVASASWPAFASTWSATAPA